MFRNEFSLPAPGLKGWVEETNTGVQGTTPSRKEEEFSQRFSELTFYCEEHHRDGNHKRGLERKNMRNAPPGPNLKGRRARNKTAESSQTVPFHHRRGFVVLIMVTASECTQKLSANAQRANATTPLSHHLW